MFRNLAKLVGLAALAMVSVAAVDLDKRFAAGDAEDYLRPRYFEPKAGVCLVFDDGYSSFRTQFIKMSDDIYDSVRVRIKGTVGFMPSQEGTSGWLTYDDLKWVSRSRADNQNQENFEIALHGLSTERFGSRNGGFSRTWMDSTLNEWQTQQLVANGVEKARTLILPNHRYTPGLEKIWRANGIYQVGGLSVPLNADTTKGSGGALDNEHTPMEMNYDPWPQLSYGTNSTTYNGFQRHGGIQNRYNIGRRQSYSTATDTHIDSMRVQVDLAVQTGSMVILTFHNIDPDTSASALTILPSDLRVLMDHIAEYMVAGALESLTFEQMTARGAGKVHGELFDHLNFARLSDLVDSAFATNSSAVPMRWPLSQSVGNFYPFGNDTIVNSTAAGDSNRSKVWSIADDGDTVLAIFTEESLQDSVSYGASADSAGDGRLWISGSPDGNTSNAIPILVKTSGVDAPYVEITVQAMVDNALSSRGYLAARFFQYSETWEDVVNYNSDAYDFMPYTGVSGAYTLANQDLRAMRIRPLFNAAMLDTTIIYDEAFWTAGTTLNGDPYEYFNFMKGLLPPAIYDQQGSHDWRQPFGNYADLSANSTSDQSLLANIQSFTADETYATINYGNAIWHNFTWRVPIVPGMTDWVAGHVFLRRDVAWTGNPTTLISNISAVAGR